MCAYKGCGYNQKDVTIRGVPIRGVAIIKRVWLLCSWLGKGKEAMYICRWSYSGCGCGFPTDEVYMTSVSWVIPTMDQQVLEDPALSLHPQPNTPNINTCRPMSYQEEGAKVSKDGLQ